MAETLGELVKRRRHALGLTQEQLAHAADVASRTVRNIERGERKPTRATLEQLRRALQLRRSDVRNLIRSQSETAKTKTRRTARAG